MKKLYVRYLFGLLVAMVSLVAQAQQIVIDQPVNAGKLTLFREMSDENSYYYLADQIKVANNENGKPQFSFLKYVENVRSAPGEEDVQEGLGGGILHVVVSLAVSPEQLAEAKTELRKVNANGVVKGPIIYSGGTMSIVSAFTNTEGDLSRQVVGIGKAPLIDGQKAAVSLDLTKKGARILWESFKTPNPDISFSFEMELSGFRAPKQAIIEANFDKMYSHQAFQAGAVGNYGKVMFGGEIELAFDELRNNGAIKITKMGSDAEMDKLIESAYNKLTTMMFKPIGTDNPLVKSIAGQKSPMERATNLYKLNKKAPAKKSGKKASRLVYPFNDDLLLASVDAKVSAFAYRPKLFPSFLNDDWEPKHIKEHYKDFIRLLTISNAKKEEACQQVDNGKYVNANHLSKSTGNKQFLKAYLMSEAEKGKFQNILEGAADSNDDFVQLIRERIIAIIYKQDFLNEKQKEYLLSFSEPDAELAWDDNLALTYIAWVNRDSIVYMPNNEKYAEIVKKIDELKDKDVNLDKLLAEDLDATQKDAPDKSDPTKTATPPPTVPGSSTQKDKPDELTNAKKTEGKKPESPKAKDNKADTKKGKDSTAKKKEEKDFKMAVMASYEMKKVKQKGNFKINLNKYTSDKIVLRFDENIGQIDCDDCFFEVNLDDPMFKQREIVAMLDGFNANDFGKYINYVNLKMKKKHQNGEITMDEVRIDRDNFSKAANNFKMMYGWKGDDNRSKWLDYEVQAQWSFFGGYETNDEWRAVNTNVINLAAPYLRRTIELEADPDMLKDQKVRSVSVSIYYQMGEKEQVQKVSMLPSRDQFSSTVGILLPPESEEYEYEINWRLFGNTTQSTGRQKSTEPILFVDELPE